MNPALLIVDIQNDYFPGGKMPLEGSIEASEKAKLLLAKFREKGFPVFHIQHWSIKPNATFFLPNTEGAAIHENVRPLPGEIVIQKNFPNSFRQTALLDGLKERSASELVVAGMMTHMCIDATTRAAFDLGFKCTLAHDACATKSLAFGETTVPAQHVHSAFVSALHGTYADARTALDISQRL
jgi:nicotinamidase-related amidase